MVIAEYARELAADVARLWSLDKPGMLLRARALPADRQAVSRAETDHGERRGLRWFIAERLKARPELAAVADELSVRDDDAYNIVAKYIEQRKDASAQ